MRKFIILASTLMLASSAFAQWTEPLNITNYGAFLEPRAIAVGDTLHVVGEGGIIVFYVRSPDNGLHWTDPVAPADTFYEGSQMPDIAYTNGIFHIVYSGMIEGSYRHQAFHLMSSDGGRTWPVRNRIFNNSAYGLRSPKLATKGDTLFFACHFQDELRTFRSLDNGQTWGDSVVVESGPYVIDGFLNILYVQSRVHLIYQLNIVGDSLGIEIYDRYSDDFGFTWSDRVALSTLEYTPNARDGQFPSAYADSSGNIIALWFDYKYGSQCGVTGDILGRVSRDNGDTWLPETRLTYTQTGSTSSCLIVDDILYAVWADQDYFNCANPKIMYSESHDWGATWSEPVIITGYTDQNELDPVLVYTGRNAGLILHCVARIRPPGDNRNLYYLRNQEFTSILKEQDCTIPKSISIMAYPNPFNSHTTISVQGLENDDSYVGIFDIRGNLVKSINLEQSEGGDKIAYWDATNDLNTEVASGIYFIIIRQGRNILGNKIMLLK